MKERGTMEEEELCLVVLSTSSERGCLVLALLMIVNC